MKLNSIKTSHYRSLLNLNFEVRQLNLLIGANASGKSNILDALRFLCEGVRERDFSTAVSSRGGFIQVVWKGEEAREFDLSAEFEDQGQKFRWQVRVVRRAQHRDFFVEEALYRNEANAPPTALLQARQGKGSWYSEGGRQVHLSLTTPTGCALAAAAADEAFPARAIANFVGEWGFFDPNPASLRLATTLGELSRLDSLGRNLALRLLELQAVRPEVFNQIVEVVRSLLGVPDKIEPRISDDGSVYFVQRERGMKFAVHQKGASAGTLRMLALIVALLGEAQSSLVGFEEPENYVHPSALSAFAEIVRQASEKIQVILTTHSPLLLNYLGVPDAVCVVKWGQQGTEVEREDNPEAVRKALAESGFGLGDFYETKGFGR